jgi:hypothetical protein
MPLTWRNTTYTELYNAGYPQETFGQQISEATRVFLVPWEEREQAVLDFLGYSIAVDAIIPAGQFNAGTACQYVSRITPDFHPDYLRTNSNNQPYLWADSVSIEPFGMVTDTDGNPIYDATDPATISSNETPVFNFAKMSVHYSTRLYPILNDSEMNTFDGIIDESSLLRYVEVQKHPQAEYLTLPDGTFNYVAGGGVPAAPVPGAPGKVQNMTDLTLIWRQVPRIMVASAEIVQPIVNILGGVALDPAAIDYSPGRVNAFAIWGYPAGTLLCEAPELTPWVQCDGEIVFDVTFHFKYLPAFNDTTQTGHNYLLAKTTGLTPNKVLYTEVSTDGTAHAEPARDGVHIYNSCDFSDLFKGYFWSAGKTPQAGNN